MFHNPKLVPDLPVAPYREPSLGTESRHQSRVNVGETPSESEGNPPPGQVLPLPKWVERSPLRGKRLSLLEAQSEPRSTPVSHTPPILQLRDLRYTVVPTKFLLLLLDSPATSQGDRPALRLPVGRRILVKKNQVGSFYPPARHWMIDPAKL